MGEVERTAAGFQIVLPGCEGRTLPKSVTRSDGTGQGLFQFFSPPKAKEKLDFIARAPLDGSRRKQRIGRSR